MTKTISELRIALPQLRLEQAIHNVCRWLLDGDDAAKVDISLEVTKDAASLIFTLAGTARELPSVSTLLEDLNQNKPEAVYGYLAQKIAARYGGGLASEQDRMVLILPLAEGDEISITKENIEALRQRIKEQRLFLDAKKRITFSPRVPDAATTLMNPLVEDLLANIEGMLTLLSQSPGLDLQNYPWSAIQRNYRFFRLLALDLQKDRPIIPAPVNLKSLLESLEPMLMPRMLDHEIIIESDIPRPVINSDQMRLSQIFVNLALNALEAMPDGGTLKFHLKQDHRHAIVEVIDDGVGISPEDQPHIFSAHFTTKSSDHGGAGLHRVKKYLEQLNGQIEVYSKLGEGTRLAVKLPLNWESGYF